MSELNISKIEASSIKRNMPPVETEKRWSVAQIVELFELPFNDLMHRAQTVHRENFDPNGVQVSTLLSIKNRWLFRRLWLLPTGCSISHRC